MDKKSLNVVMSSKSDDWSTPKEIYEKVLNMGFVDPCPLNALDKGLNCLQEPAKGGRLYINPPYSNIDSFVDWALENVFNGNVKEFIFLVPARTDTKWFSKLFKAGCLFAFVKGRLKFGYSNASAPFPSVLIWYNPKKFNSGMLLVEREEICNFLDLYNEAQKCI